MSTGLLAGVLTGVTVLAGCGGQAEGNTDSTRPPAFGACRVLTPEDIRQSTNDTPAVDCTEEHTAETFVVSTFGDEVATDKLDDRTLGAYVYDVCQPAFMEFLGGDESLVMRSILTWAWFRPSQEAWDAGARWFRCDVVGGGEQSKTLVNLPKTAKGALLGRPDDRWITCAVGPTVTGSVKVPCAQKHDWRAIATVRIGSTKDEYPGDRAVESKTRDYCSDQVAAWLGYPVADYDFGYTWFREGEWNAGNRRSICWAKTDQ